LKFIHTSDWHLGKSLFGKKLIDEQALFFEKTFFPLVKDVKPDILIITGDIIDKPNPDLETLKLLSEILFWLFKEKIPSLFILGNHDSKRITLFKEFLKQNYLYMIDNLYHFKAPFIWEDEKGEKIYFYILPYLPLYEFKENIEIFWGKENKIVVDFFVKKSQLLLKDLVELLLNLTKDNFYRPAIALGHFAIEKGIFTGEEISLKFMGLEEVFPLELFKNFDFLLLGHLHRLQKVSSKVFYSGSILPYSFEESVHKKGVWFFEIKNSVLVKEEPIYLSPSFEMKIVKGYFKDLINSPKDEAYIKIILKDEEPVLHPFERLKTVFPNLLLLEYEDKKTEISSFSKDFIMEEFLESKKMELNEEELFKKFYKYIEEKEIEDKLFEAFKKYLKEFKENQREVKSWP
jgi:exonuclease SbcD